MKKVYLYGRLGAKYGREHVFNVDTGVDVIKALDANFEDFTEYIIRAEKERNPYIILNKAPGEIRTKEEFEKSYISEEECRAQNSGLEIHIIPTAQGSAALSTVIFSVGSFKLTVGGLIATIAIAVVMQVIMNALFKPPKPPQRKDPVSTKSFLLAGSSTRQAQGIPVPLGYGMLKIGPANVAIKKTNKKLSKTGNASHLESYTEVEFLDLLCEGPIEGFVNANGALLTSDNIYQSIFLNETPIQNPGNSVTQGGTYNYILNETHQGKGKPDFKLGSDSEDKILADAVYTVKEYDTLLYGPPPYGLGNKHKDGKNNTVGQYAVKDSVREGGKILSHFISNPDVSSATFSFKTELSTREDDGGVSENTCAFAIMVCRNNKDYNVLDSESGCKTKTASGVAKKTSYGDDKYGPENHYFQIKGIATSPYQFDITVDFDSRINRQEISQGVTFKVLRISPELDPTVKGGNVGGIMQTKRLQLAHVMEKIDERLLYPNSAMIKTMIDSKNFNQTPDRTYHIKMKKVLIPQNYDPVSRTYSGTWNGLFKGQESDTESIYSITDNNKKWTDNPAWILFDLLHNPRYGVGKYGLDETNIDKWQLYKIGKYCDELVKTGYPVETSSGFARRFSTDNVINPQTSPDSFEITIHPGDYNSNLINGVYSVSDSTDMSVYQRYSVEASGKEFVVKDSKKNSFLNNYTYTQTLYEFSFGHAHSRGGWTNGFEIKTEIRKSNGNLLNVSIYRNPHNIYHAARGDMHHDGAKIEITREYLQGFSGQVTYSDLESGALDQAKQDFDSIDEADLATLFDFSSEPVSQVVETFSSESEANEYISQNNNLDFIEEFGNKESFKGKKIAFFMYHGDDSISNDEIAYRSATYSSQISIQERTIISSDPSTRKLVVSGPALPQSHGACASQISHRVVEPRFSANLLLTDRAEALEIMQNLCSVFRGMIAYSNGQIFALQDSHKKPIQIFNNSNVSKEGFSYFGTHANKKVTACLVRYNNREKNYRPDVVYEEDSNAIAKFGYSENETLGLGITSASQARRLAKWILYTSQLETESIKFKTGIEGSYLFPGSVFKVSDELRIGRNRGGRLLNIYFHQDFTLEDSSVVSDTDIEILLDKTINREGVTSNVEVIISCGLPGEDYDTIQRRAPYYLSEEDQDTEIDSTYAPQIYTFDAMVGSRNAKCLLHNLTLKIPITLDVKKSIFESYNHKMEDGDLVKFKTGGTLPSGLNKRDVYTVVNSTKHSFQVSLNGSSVSFYDIGKDELRNEGGSHFACPYSPVGETNRHLKNACLEISPGSSYILNGGFSIPGSNEAHNGTINSALEVDESATKPFAEWRLSKILGEIYVDLRQEGWVYSAAIDEWIYVGSLIRGNQWFWSNSLGWIAIIKEVGNVYWYIQQDDEYIYFNYNTLSFFIFEENVGGGILSWIVQIVNGQDYLSGKKIERLLTIGSHGIHFKFYNSFSRNLAGIYSFEDTADILAAYPDYFSASNVPPKITGDLNLDNTDSLSFYSISDILSTFEAESSHGQSCVTLILSDVDEKILMERDSFTVVGFNSTSSELNTLMNKNWSYKYKSSNVVELIGSEEAYAVLVENDNSTFRANLDMGNIQVINLPESTNQREAQAQTFRTSFVKEVSENQYEVFATEYNPSKFDTIEKIGVLKRPNIPIPPQPDMSIPDGPTNLQLTAMII